MLVAIPVSAFFIFALTELGQSSPIRRGWRDAFLKSAVLWGTLAALIPEGLGLFAGITRTWLAVAWLLALSLMVGWGVRHGLIGEGWRRLRSLRPPDSSAERGLILGLALVCLILLAVALAAPTNNVDSLGYHMSRVVHWAQNRSLRHYAASYYPQVSYPHWAEVAILNLHVLWGGDRLANLVQWSSMVGSLVAVSAIAASLGASTRGQLAASAFALSIPMGVLQSTSTQNDYAAGFWAALVAYFVALDWTRGLTRHEFLYLTLAFGLGLLTKATFFVYGAPFMLAYLARRLRKEGIVSLLLRIVVLIGVVSLLNSGVWLRNLITYGGPYGSPQVVSEEIAFLEALRPGPTDEQRETVEPPLRAEDSHPDAGILKEVVSFLEWSGARIAESAALNLVTPVKFVNDRLYAALGQFPSIFRDHILRALSNAAWNHEDTAGNPIHLAAVPFCLAALLFLARARRTPGLGLLYSSLALSTFPLLAIAIQLATTDFGVRFQLPFFILWGPVVGVVVSGLGRRWLSGFVGAGLILSAWPYVLLNNTRPVIGHTPWPTRVNSVFTAPPQEIAFAAWPELQEPYMAAVGLIEARSCTRVALRIDSGDPEYLFWWLLDAPQSGYRLENLNTDQSLERYIVTDFDPCVAVCTICGNRTELGGLALVTDFSGVRIFAPPGEDGPD